ncbi:hypothetical protein PVAP13_6KG201618 [Panicum virgatum]|uniref:Uncharacterized protein n=1 Tax=Panicum virgatum TaxID=38727 RepID=A0A8T0RE73_PANVG|nr:hypothetical protein PVAP13_6KG201618 [Panicum virgatum]
MSRKSVQLGLEPTVVEVYEAGHKGKDPTIPDVLCRQTASERLGAYRDEMIRRHGPDCDWRHMPIDAQAVHASSGGKAHGWFSLFDGMMNTREVRASQRLASSSQSCGGSSR